MLATSRRESISYALQTHRQSTAETYFSSIWNRVCWLRLFTAKDSALSAVISIAHQTHEFKPRHEQRPRLRSLSILPTLWNEES